MKHMKVCGAKGRNTIAFLEGKHAKTLEVRKAWEQNDKI